MLNDLPGLLRDLPLLVLATGGLSGVFALTLLEKILPVMPSYPLFILIGAGAGGEPGTLLAILLTATAGSVVGAVGWYGLGRLWGEARCAGVVDRWGRRLFLPPDAWRRFASAYTRRQFLVTLLAQIVPVARIYLALPAGVARVAFFPFLLATSLGTLAWNAPFILVGFLAGDGDSVALSFAAVLIPALMLAGALIGRRLFREDQAIG